MTTSSGFAPPTQGASATGTPTTGASGLAGGIGGDLPVVLRGAAADWPAVRRWTFDRLADLGPHRAVRLVRGNRELGETVFVDGSLGDYLRALDPPPPGGPPRYLKEFDLLRAFPRLRADLRPDELIPPRAVRSNRVWIGPATATTGLHYDYLDNVAVQVIGSKRFSLLPPGSVERRAAVSPKYDSWARLARLTASQVAQLDAGLDDPVRPLVVDLSPGDALYVPRRWWHEVANLTPSLLLSGFFGPPRSVLPTWLRVRARDGLHGLGVLGRRGCTCHGPVQAGAAITSAVRTSERKRWS